MNGKIQGIIVCGVIIACLGGTLAFLNATGGDSSSDTDSSSQTVNENSEDTSVLLIDSTADDIKSIAAVNEYGGFTMSRPASGKTAWTIEELNGINQSSSLQSGMAEDVAQLEAYKTVEENSSDLGKYGLESPAGEFTVTFTDDTQSTFCIGDVSTKTRYRYLCEKGESDVYMILNSRVSYFIEPKENLVDTSLIEDPGDSDMPDYGTLTVRRSDLDYDMVFENDPYDKEGMVSSQVMTEPIFSYLNVSVSSATTHGMWGLSAESAVKIFPDEEDFKTYGLDEPLAEVTFKGDGYNYDLKIGDPIYEENDDGEQTAEIASYYCYLTGVDGVDCVWTVSADSLPWATVMPGDVVTSLMTTNNIMDVSEVRVTAEDSEIVYELDSDGESTINSVKMNGEDIDVSLFQDLYKYLLTCPTSEIYFEEPQGESYLTIEISCEDGYNDVMEFYSDSSRRSIVALNGRPSFRIQSKWTDRFLENMENVKNGEAVVDTY
ncbi:DUF4340 domain-containing protein [Ruminococcus sp. Marseille-P6503]|uniref:DUF4340 domain-containing protein n=1 Tax=Ruminococcus sp. Marseille-P6503 TaxID=2364796 RepID=UPI000F544BD1|nr:DUF4340 domain-containing protein [Ruminococcus sp. Marseille-P6503]